MVLRIVQNRNKLDSVAMDFLAIDIDQLADYIPSQEAEP